MKSRKSMRRLRQASLAGISLAALSVGHAQTATPEPAPDAAPIEAITITGTRVASNGNSAPTPVTMVSVQELQATHPSTLFEALLDQPVFAGSRGAMSSVPGSAGGSNGPNNNQISSLNLRGLGSIRTLILYDGHRVPPTQQNGLVDNNTIPQMLLKRVDIVTGGASAVYGSDAIGGVVNFITNRSFNGVKIEAQDGQSERGFAASHQLGIAAGTSLFEGRGHIEGSIQNIHDAGVLHRNDLGSPFSDRWTIQGAGTAASPFFLASQATNQSATFGGKITSAAGQPANPLNNYQFAGNGVLAPMNTGSAVGTTGDLRVGGDGYYHTGSTLKPQADLSQVYGRFDYDINDDLHFYATFAGTLDHSLSYNTNNQLQNFKLGSSNAYLPLAYQQQMQAAGVQYFNLSEVFGPDSNVQAQNFDFYTRTKYFNTGLEGSLGKYKWETSYSHADVTLDAQNNYTTNYGRLYAAMDAVKDASGNIVCNVTLTNPGLYPGCVPVSLFGPTAVSQAGADYIRNQSEFLIKMPTDDVSGNLTGSPFNNWAGPVNVAVSGEWRRQRYSLTTNAPPADYAPLDCTGIRFGNCVTPTASSVGSPIYNLAVAPRPPVSMTVGEVALESDVPLLKDAPLAKSADLNLAYRYASYSAEGNTDISAPSKKYTFDSKTWKIGLAWRINDVLSWRTARSRDLRAPNLNDLFSPKTTTFSGGFVDRWTGTNFTSTGALPATESSGNPNLRPEVAGTTTLGVVFTPTAQFSLAVDAFNIRINDFITRVAGSDSVIQDACYAGAAQFCALQLRPQALGASKDPAVNAVTKWLSRPINISSMTTRGADVEANYKTKLDGHAFSLRAFATYQPHVYYEQLGAPTQDGAGSLSATNPAGAKIRTTVSAHYSPTERIGIDWQTRWRSSLHYTADATQVALPNTNVPSAAYSNLNLSYRFDGPIVGKATVYLNIQNVFGKAAPISGLSTQSPGTVGGFALGDDPLGRYYNFGVRWSL